MTRKKPGHNLDLGESADAATHKTSPANKDGPEEYTEDASIGGSENGKVKAPHANSADTSSASKSKTHKNQKIVTGELGMVKTNLGLRPSRFGSPFAYSAWLSKHDFFKGLPVESTRVLFDQIVAEAPSLRERFSPSFLLTNDGRNGQFCVYRKREPLGTNSDSGKESNHNSQLELYGFEPNGDQLKLPLFVDPVFVAVHRTHNVRNVLVDSTSSSGSSATTIGSAKNHKVIDVLRVRNPKSGDYEYFVVNTGLDFLSVNGLKVDRTARAGPLPEFAVIEFAVIGFGCSSIFWWRTAAALDYMPVRTSKLSLLTT